MLKHRRTRTQARRTRQMQTKTQVSKNRSRNRAGEQSAKTWTAASVEITAGQGGEAEAASEQIRSERDHQHWLAFNRMSEYGPAFFQWNDLQCCAFLAAVIAQNARALWAVVEAGTKDGVPSFEARQLAEAIEVAERVNLQADWPESVEGGESIVLRSHSTYNEAYEARSLVGLFAWGLYASADAISSDCLFSGSRASGLALAEGLAMAESWCHGDGTKTEISDAHDGPESPLQKQARKMKIKMQCDNAGKLAVPAAERRAA
jgi:hypothetical protein